MGLRVGDLADAAGVSTQTIRLWERQGLLHSERSAGGQRLFDEEALQRAQQVAMMRRRHGWNPAAIRSTLGNEGTGSPGPGYGARIRAARQRRGLTLEELASDAGLSRSFLSAIERGENTVTPRLLSALAQSLELPMSAFTPATERGDRVVREPDRARSTMAEGVEWEELATPGHTLEPAILIVPPGGSSGGAYARPGEVFVTMLAGQLAFESEHGIDVLKRGDSILLEPLLSWSWRNPGRSRARAVYVEQLQADAWR